jgi:hypothetical protein
LLLFNRSFLIFARHAIIRNGSNVRHDGIPFYRSG